MVTFLPIPETRFPVMKSCFLIEKIPLFGIDIRPLVFGIFYFDNGKRLYSDE
jgi:hypothetical protein